MAKKNKIEMTLPSQGEFNARVRRSSGIDGTVNGGTKVVSNKGKKAYSRSRAKDQRNW